MEALAVQRPAQARGYSRQSGLDRFCGRSLEVSVRLCSYLQAEQCKSQGETEEPQQPQYDLVKEEQILWIHRISKGVLHREVVEEWIITNMRAMKRYPESKNNPTRRISFIGFGTDCDMVVMNQRRQSQGSRVGNFVGSSAGGGFGGVTFGTSRAYSDLVFLLNGKEHLRFSGISDPQGVKRMIQTIKKQTRKP